MKNKILFRVVLAISITEQKSILNGIAEKMLDLPEGS